MRLLVLLPVLGAALMLGGCSLAGDCSAPAPAPLPALVHLGTAPAPDTLTVLFVNAGAAYGDETMRVPRPLAPVATSDGSFRLHVETLAYTGPRTAPQFETAVQGDTVFVRRALVQSACSYAEGVEHRIVRIEAPAGVRVVRVRTVDSVEVPFPASSLSAPPARPFLTA